MQTAGSWEGEMQLALWKLHIWNGSRIILSSICRQQGKRNASCLSGNHTSGMGAG
jgi:hypothetical protein